MTMNNYNSRTSELSGCRYCFLYIRHILKHRMRLQLKKLLVAVCIVIFLMWFVKYLRFRNLEWDFDDEDTLGHVRNPGMKHDKWIVVTTINQPTEAIKVLNNIEGWKLVVVGDRKTPKSWSFDGVIYLGPAAQKKLGYKVHPLLPYDSYSRKIIGYLYAIEHGAEYIYDTDDDNIPTSGPDSFQGSLGQVSGLIVNTQNLTYNPYRHFGQSTMWPRGYPLENIGLPDTHDYHSCNVHVPSIQQGLVSGDPDVDAMFRLTRQHGKGILNLTFDSGAPPVFIPKGTFAPMNSQNTLFTAKALWAMVLPTTVSDRATDIYRSYWAQRLLWLLGEHVGFYPPNSHQKRNRHSNLVDAKEESDLYQTTGHLTKFLHTWSCNGMFFFDCASQLAHDMVPQGFWLPRDAELVDAWITDLATIGYAPPSLKVRDLCLDDAKSNVVFYPDEQNSTLPHSSSPVLTTDLTNHVAIKEKLASTCRFPHEIHYGQIINTVTKYTDLVLVVGVDSTDPIPLIEAAHRPHFPHIVYCSATALSIKFFHEWRLTYIRPDSQLTTGMTCVQAAMNMHHSLAGYLYISDHTWMVKGNGVLPSKHPSLMWVTGEVDVYRTETQALCDKQALSCELISKDLIEQFIKQVPTLEKGETKFKSELRQCLVKIASDPNFPSKPQLTWITDASFYYPGRLRENIKLVDQLFSESKTKRKYDFLSPLVLECLELTVEYLQYSFLEELQEGKNINYVLPFSFNDLSGGAEDSIYKAEFCQHFQNLNH